MSEMKYSDLSSIPEVYKNLLKLQKLLDLGVLKEEEFESKVLLLLNSREEINDPFGKSNQVCPHCGSSDLRLRYDGTKFCRNCGAQVLTCSVCGSSDLKYNDEGELFCRNCGARGDILFNGLPEDISFKGIPLSNDKIDYFHSEQEQLNSFNEPDYPNVDISLNDIESDDIEDSGSKEMSLDDFLSVYGSDALSIDYSDDRTDLVFEEAEDILDNIPESSYIPEYYVEEDNYEEDTSEELSLEELLNMDNTGIKTNESNSSLYNTLLDDVFGEFEEHTKESEPLEDISEEKLSFKDKLMKIIGFEDVEEDEE